MGTTRHVDYQESVDSIARLYAAALWALHDAQAKAEDIRQRLLAAVERER